MKAHNFDGITRPFTEVSNRRGILRLLGGAAAIGAGLVLREHGDMVARPKANKGGKKPSPQAGAAGKSRRGGPRRQKTTICYRSQTRSVSKQGWRQKYRGGKPGPCPVDDSGLQQPPCTSWILSGGPDPAARILVDDDLAMTRYSRDSADYERLIQDASQSASSLPPVIFNAKAGDYVGFDAFDYNPACRSLSPLWLHCATTGQKRQVFSGNNDGCAAGRLPGFFVTASFDIEL